MGLLGAPEAVPGALSGTRRRRRGLLRVVAVAVVSAPALALSPPTVAGAATPGPDPGYARQWNLARVGVEAAWTATQGHGAVVAIVDSGVDLGHEDLRDRVVAETGCIGAAGDPGRCGGSGQDEDGHGTHVAGIAAASTGNGLGVAGVAPGASLLAVRVLQRQCDGAGCSVAGSGSDVAAGIRWATRRGADVINLSLGHTVSPTLGPDFDAAVEEAWDGGAVIVLAAGSDLAASPLTPDSPAIVVTATTREDLRPAYSHEGQAGPPARFAMAAPGGEPGDSITTCATQPVGVLSTYVSDGQGTYGCLAGTSMAAPHVAGAAALLRSLGLDAPETRAVLLATADDLGAPGVDPVYGAGRLNVARAVAEGAAAAARRAAPVRTVPPTVLPGDPGEPVPLPPPHSSPPPEPVALDPILTATPPTSPTTSPPPEPAAPPPTSPPPGPVAVDPGPGDRGGQGRLLPGAGAAVLAAGTGAGAWRVRRRLLP